MSKFSIGLDDLFVFTGILASLFNNRFNHTSGVTAVTPTDRPKSVRNRCVIKVFGGVFMLSPCFLDFSVGVGAFVTGLRQIFSFFSYCDKKFELLQETQIVRS